ncbi:TPA: hypothetical protein ACPE0E_002581 [Klebsiella michiganensis]
MTNDITELAQMKGQKVEGSYYLAECTDCGKMYPSNKLNGGEPLFCGDYGECYCPHCNADDAAIGDCGDTAATAWNYQQNRIDALVEALEKAQQRIAVLEEAEQKLCAANVTLDARAELAERRLAEMDSRTVTVKLPVSLDFDCEMENGDYDIDEEPYLRGKVDGFNYALTKVRRLNGTAGIKWEAE